MTLVAQATIGQGEALRAHVDRSMEVNPAQVRFLFQGASDWAYHSHPFAANP